jgi:hypothetical protein
VGQADVDDGVKPGAPYDSGTVLQRFEQEVGAIKLAMDSEKSQKTLRRGLDRQHKMWFFSLKQIRTTLWRGARLASNSSPKHCLGGAKYLLRSKGQRSISQNLQRCSYERQIV